MLTVAPKLRFSRCLAQRSTFFLITMLSCRTRVKDEWLQLTCAFGGVKEVGGNNFQRRVESETALVSNKFRVCSKRLICSQTFAFGDKRRNYVSSVPVKTVGIHICETYRGSTTSAPDVDIPYSFIKRAAKTLISEWERIFRHVRS